MKGSEFVLKNAILVTAAQHEKLGEDKKTKIIPFKK